MAESAAGIISLRAAEMAVAGREVNIVMTRATGHDAWVIHPRIRVRRNRIAVAAHFIRVTNNAVVDCLREMDIRVVMPAHYMRDAFHWRNRIGVAHHARKVRAHVDLVNQLGHVGIGGLRLMAQDAVLEFAPPAMDGQLRMALVAGLGRGNLTCFRDRSAIGTEHIDAVGLVLHARDRVSATVLATELMRRRRIVVAGTAVSNLYEIDPSEFSVSPSAS